MWEHNDILCTLVMPFTFVQVNAALTVRWNLFCSVALPYKERDGAHQVARLIVCCHQRGGKLLFFNSFILRFWGGGGY